MPHRLLISILFLSMTAQAQLTIVGGASVSGSLATGSVPQQQVTTTCVWTTRGVSQTCTISYTDSFGAEVRTLRLRIPAGLSSSSALIFYVHGAQGTELECENKTWHTKAEKVSAVLACPLGLPQSTGHTTWNGYFDQATYTEGHPPDDVNFFKVMIGLLQANLHTDVKATFVTGLSAGAMLTHRLGNELGDKIAAIAPVAQTARTYNGGTLPIPTAPAMIAPVSALILQGDADGSFPYCGKFTTLSTQAVIESVDFDFNFWAGSSRDKCTVFDTTGNLCTADYTGVPTALTGKHGSSCLSGTDVQFYRLAAGVHKYYAGETLTTPPGTAALPYNPAFNSTVGTNAIDIIWNFFAAHKKQ